VLALFLGVYWALRTSFLAFSFLVFGSWALLVLVVASSGPGGFRLTRQSSAAARPPTVAPPASCGWLGILKGVSWEGLCGKVCAGSEDIFLSECNGGGGGRALCTKRSEREQGREMVYKKV
jgi:hypothetical protein